MTENDWINNHYRFLQGAYPEMLGRLTEIKRTIVDGSSDKRVNVLYYRFLGSVLDHAIERGQEQPDMIREITDYVRSAVDYGGELIAGNRLGEGFDPDHSSIDTLLTVEKFEEYHTKSESTHT